MNYICTETCSTCGGRCCKQCAGSCFPSDFGETRREIEKGVFEALRSGKYAIDWWEGDPRPHGNLGRAYFIRPAHKGAGRLFDPSWGGECVFLTDTGCSLEHDSRPMGCRELEPKEDRECVIHASKKEACVEWIPYNDAIETFGRSLQ